MWVRIMVLYNKWFNGSTHLHERSSDERVRYKQLLWVNLCSHWVLLIKKNQKKSQTIVITWKLHRNCLNTMICITMDKLNWTNHGHTFPHIIYTLYSHLSRVIKHSEFLMIDLNLYNIIDLAYICFWRVTIRAILPGRVLARISTLPKISRFWLCLRAVYDIVSLCFRNALEVLWIKAI